MKVSRRVIDTKCDLCKKERRNAEEKCDICGNDICDLHLVEISTTRHYVGVLGGKDQSYKLMVMCKQCFRQQAPKSWLDIVDKDGGLDVTHVTPRNKYKL